MRTKRMVSLIYLLQKPHIAHSLRLALCFAGVSSVMLLCFSARRVACFLSGRVGAHSVAPYFRAE
jgi:hypothetical protein